MASARYVREPTHTNPTTTLTNLLRHHKRIYTTKSISTEVTSRTMSVCTRSLLATRRPCRCTKSRLNPALPCPCRPILKAATSRRHGKHHRPPRLCAKATPLRLLATATLPTALPPALRTPRTSTMSPQRHPPARPRPQRQTRPGRSTVPVRSSTPLIPPCARVSLRRRGRWTTHHHSKSTLSPRSRAKLSTRCRRTTDTLLSAARQALILCVHVRTVHLSKKTIFSLS